MKKKKTSGKTILEIVGVIALTALLSLVGITMISKLMAKQKANQVVEEAKSAGFIFVSDYFHHINIDEHHDVTALLSINTTYQSVLMKETESWLLSKGFTSKKQFKTKRKIFLDTTEF